MPFPSHQCGPPYPLKKNASCLCCGEPTFEVRDVYLEGPLAGTPRRVGRMLDTGTQVEFLMSDGSEADISFCLPCVDSLRPEHYQAVWTACLDRAELSFTLSGHSPNQRKILMAQLMAVWPVALLRKRREGVEDRTLVIDRR